MEFIVAVDGPAGSGKGTITKKWLEKKKIISIYRYRSIVQMCNIINA